VAQREGKTSFREEISVKLPFQQVHSIHAILNPAQYKLHYERKEINYDNLAIKFYGGVQGSSNLHENIFKVGVELIQSQHIQNLRLRLQQDEPSFIVYHKSEKTDGHLSLGLINAYDILNQVWKFSSIQLGWSDFARNSCFFQTKGGSRFGKVDPRLFLENASLSYVHRYNESTRLGM
jgi:hypothetical protein